MRREGRKYLFRDVPGVTLWKTEAGTKPSQVCMAYLEQKTGQAPDSLTQMPKRAKASPRNRRH